MNQPDEYIIAGTLTDASNSMVANANIIQKVYFPRLIIPAATAVTGLVDLAFASLILIGMMVHYGYHPHLAGVLILLSSRPIAAGPRHRARVPARLPASRLVPGRAVVLTLAPWFLTMDSVLQAFDEALAAGRQAFGVRCPDGWDGHAAERIMAAPVTASASSEAAKESGRTEA